MTSSFADDLLPGRNATVSFIKASSGKIPGSRGAQPGYGITGSPDKAQAAIREPLPGGAALTGATNRSGLVARIRRQSPSGKDAGLHRQHVLEHHPGGDRRADHPGHVRPIACISRKFCPSASRPTLLDTRAAIGNADTPAEPISGLILCLLI
ncbi:hypothetical protein ACUXKK_004170 [Klebsiella aerogenes]|nr:hypothetical protein AZZ81_004251 [Klebsiella aerogenes]